MGWTEVDTEMTIALYVPIWYKVLPRLQVQYFLLSVWFI